MAGMHGWQGTEESCRINETIIAYRDVKSSIIINGLFARG